MVTVVQMKIPKPQNGTTHHATGSLRDADLLGIAIVVDFLPDEGGTGEMARLLALELSRRGHHVVLASRWPVDRRGTRAKEIRRAGVDIVTPKWLGRPIDDRLWPNTYNVRRLKTALRLAWQRRTVPTRARLNNPVGHADRERAVHDIVVQRLARSRVLQSAPQPPVIHVICRTTAPVIEPLRSLGWPIVYTETGRLASLGFDPATVGSLDVDAYVADSAPAARELAGIENRDVEIVHSLGGFAEPIPTGPTSSRRLVTIGRLVPGKRLDIAVRAVERLEGFSLDVHGSGDEQPVLQELADRLGVSERVRFCGFADREGVREALDGGDVFVLCSESEGTPTAVIEAMSRGRPIVTTRVGGVPELVDDGCEALFFDGSVDGLVAAVTRLRDDPALAGRLGVAARARWERDLQPGGLVDRYEQIYRAVLTRRRLP
jgi:glycosyltransferase involved in cell wall biosynthesis